MYTIKNNSGDYLRHARGTDAAPVYRWGSRQGCETWNSIDDLPDEITVDEGLAQPEHTVYEVAVYDTDPQQPDIRLHLADVDENHPDYYSNFGGVSVEKDSDTY
jgi:hypothetical protein